MHELAHVENILNLIGIGFEVLGFIIILPHLKRWLRKKFTQALNELEAEGEGAPIGASDEIIDSATNKDWVKLENIGIPLVIIGLVFQGLATIFHS